MKRRYPAMMGCLLGLSLLLTACGGTTGDSGSASETPSPDSPEPGVSAETPATGTYEDGSTPDFRGDRLRLTLDDGQEVVIALYDNTAVDALLERLPMEGLEFYDLSGIEKPARTPEEPFSIGEETPGYDPITGEMVIYRPWGNFTIFYGDFRYSDELVPLGIVENGLEAMAEKTEDFGGTLELLEEETPTGGDGVQPAVYMTTEITPEALTSIYEALDWTPASNVAVKLSTGEPGSNYLRTDLIGELVQSLEDPTIVECNTAYGGSRSNTAMHYQVAEDHGYTAIADVDIMDEDGSMTLPVTGGTNLTENYVGASFANYDSFLVLSHFKGHAMAGFGGAIKNISIGIASSEGKTHIHTAGQGGSMWSAPQAPFLESMAEAGKSVVEALDGQIVYINVMNRLSVDCDCDGNPAEPDMHDIGILASHDPVALDQACIDLVYAAKDGGALVSRIESRNGLHTLEHAEDIGLGSRSYQLVSLDA